MSDKTIKTGEVMITVKVGGVATFARRKEAGAWAESMDGSWGGCKVLFQTWVVDTKMFAF